MSIQFTQVCKTKGMTDIDFCPLKEYGYFHYCFHHPF